MSNKKGLIYKATSPSGKVYIGQTRVSLKTRQSQHRTSSFNEKANDFNAQFHQAIRKHGFENFIWEVLEENISLKILSNKEKQYIKKYNSLHDGYNASLDFGDYVRNKETIKKISNTKKKRGVHSGSKNSMSYDSIMKRHGCNLEEAKIIKSKITGILGKSGKDNPMYGKKLSKNRKRDISLFFKKLIRTEEHKKNISKALTGRKITDKQKKILDRTGKKHSEQTKKKISEASKLYWKKRRECL